MLSASSCTSLWGRLRNIIGDSLWRQEFCVGIPTRGRNRPRRVEKFCLRMNRREIPGRCAARNDGAGSMLKLMSEETVGGDTLETVRDGSFIAMTMIILARRKGSRRSR